VTDLLCAPNAICAICVPADALADTAQVLALAIARRAMEQARNPLNVFLCVNTLTPAAQMRAHMESMLGGAALDYMRAMVGFVDTVVLRVAPAVPAHYLEEDPLTVLDSGYPYLIADRFGYKGDWRISDKIIFSDNIAAEDMKRIYTLNMAHATLAYMGAVYGYSRLLDALHDARIYQCLQGALAESAEGLRHAFSLPREDTEAWSREVLHMLEDPYLDGPLSALGADSARKLAVNDRLVGPAMLCLRAGKKPDNLVRVMAAGYLFSQSDDPGTAKTLDIVYRSGIATAIEVISGIDLKHPLRNAALEAYYQAKDIMEGNINEN